MEHRSCVDRLLIFHLQNVYRRCRKRGEQSVITGFQAFQIISEDERQVWQVKMSVHFCVHAEKTTEWLLAKVRYHTGELDDISVPSPPGL